MLPDAARSYLRISFIPLFDGDPRRLRCGFRLSAVGRDQGLRSSPSFSDLERISLTRTLLTWLPTVHAYRFSDICRLARILHIAPCSLIFACSGGRLAKYISDTPTIFADTTCEKLIRCVDSLCRSLKSRSVIYGHAGSSMNN